MQKKWFAIPLLAFIFAGCPDSPSNPGSAGSITIAGIPQYIDEANTKAVYKIYVSVSNSADDKDPHVAQGTKVLSASDFTDGKATVTVDLYAPPPGAEQDPDPDKRGDTWSGEAVNFSVTICPQIASSAADIKVKAGFTLNDSTRNRDWEELLDLAKMGMTDKIDAIFTRIICRDGTSEGTGIIVSSAGSITIAGIPQYIDEANTKAVYKIYVSVSDSTDDKVPHVAQGTKVLCASDFTDGKATVTVDLYAPPPGAEQDPDPDKHEDSWFGEAANFSVTIYPQAVSSAADIKVKAGMTLNGSTRNRDWEEELLDLAAIGMTDQINAIFTRIICKDGTSEGTGIIAGPEWKSADETIRFVIAEHGLFFCDLTQKLNMGAPVTVTGRLEPVAGTNEFLMQDMASANEPINLMLPTFNGAKVTITYLHENQFIFSSEDPQVQGFFGGTFNKVK